MNTKEKLLHGQTAETKDEEKILKVQGKNGDIIHSLKGRE